MFIPPSRWPGWWRFFTQVVPCYPVTWICGAAISDGFAAFGIGVHGRVQFAGYPCLVLFVLGALIGALIARVAPPLAHTGRWIWLLPTLGLIYALRDTPIAWPNEELFTTPGEGGLAVYLFTMPAFVAAGYSYGLWLLSIHGITWRLACAAMAVLALGAGALRFRSFEERDVARFERIRSVASLDEMALASDRRTLCNSQTGELSLKGDIYVELLGERRACEGDQLLQPNDFGPPRSFIVDRVRVVLGTHVGSEGWVLEYGLLDPDWK